jgi:hypothetical protein
MSASSALVGVGVLADGRERLIEIPGLRGLLGSRPGGGIEGSRLGGLQKRWAHDGQVLQKFERAALLRPRTVIESRAVDLARKVQQNSDVVLQ